MKSLIKKSIVVFSLVPLFSLAILSAEVPTQQPSLSVKVERVGEPTANPEFNTSQQTINIQHDSNVQGGALVTPNPTTSVQVPVNQGVPPTQPTIPVTAPK